MKSLNNYINEKMLFNSNTANSKKIIKANTLEELNTLIKASLTNCKDGVLDLNHIDVSSITSFNNLFKDKQNIKVIYIDNWETDELISCESMFEGCVNLEEVNISNFNVKNLQSMKKMFKDCIELTNIGNISNWNISSLKDASWAFYSCEKLKLNITDLDLVSNGVKTFNINKYTEHIKI